MSFTSRHLPTFSKWLSQVKKNKTVKAGLKKPGVIVGLVVIGFLVLGMVAASVLTQMNQDVRQQAMVVEPGANTKTVTKGTSSAKGALPQTVVKLEGTLTKPAAKPQTNTETTIKPTVSSPKPVGEKNTTATTTKTNTAPATTSKTTTNITGALGSAVSKVVGTITGKTTSKEPISPTVKQPVNTNTQGVVPKQGVGNILCCYYDNREVPTQMSVNLPECPVRPGLTLYFSDFNSTQCPSRVQRYVYEITTNSCRSIGVLSTYDCVTTTRPPCYAYLSACQSAHPGAVSYDTDQITFDAPTNEMAVTETNSAGADTGVRPPKKCCYRGGTTITIPYANSCPPTNSDNYSLVQTLDNVEETCRALVIADSGHENVGASQPIISNDSGHTNVGAAQPTVSNSSLSKNGYKCCYEGGYYYQRNTDQNCLNTYRDHRYFTTVLNTKSCPTVTISSSADSLLPSTTVSNQPQAVDTTAPQFCCKFDEQNNKWKIASAGVYKSCESYPVSLGGPLTTSSSANCNDLNSHQLATFQNTSVSSVDSGRTCECICSRDGKPVYSIKSDKFTVAACQNICAKNPDSTNYALACPNAQSSGITQGSDAGYNQTSFCCEVTSGTSSITMTVTNEAMCLKQTLQTASQAKVVDMSNCKTANLVASKTSSQNLTTSGGQGGAGTTLIASGTVPATPLGGGENGGGSSSANNQDGDKKPENINCSSLVNGLKGLLCNGTMEVIGKSCVCVNKVKIWTYGGSDRGSLSYGYDSNQAMPNGKLVDNFKKACTQMNNQYGGKAKNYVCHADLVTLVQESGQTYVVKDIGKDAEQILAVTSDDEKRKIYPELSFNIEVGDGDINALIATIKSLYSGDLAQAPISLLKKKPIGLSINDGKRNKVASADEMLKLHAAYLDAQKALGYSEKIIPPIAIYENGSGYDLGTMKSVVQNPEKLAGKFMPIHAQPGPSEALGQTQNSWLEHKQKSAQVVKNAYYGASNLTKTKPFICMIYNADWVKDVTTFKTTPDGLSVAQFAKYLQNKPNKTYNYSCAYYGVY